MSDYKRIDDVIEFLNSMSEEDYADELKALTAERDGLLLVARDLAQAVELSRPYKDDCPLHKMDHRCCPPKCLVNIAVKNYRALDTKAQP